MIRSLLILTLLATTAMTGLSNAGAADVRALKWADLVPPVTATQRPQKLFLPPRRATPPTDDEPAPPPRSEAPWMSEKLASGSEPPAIVTSLNGQRIAIGGYIVPLDFDARNVTEFLLVPFVGACIHVPPPPANQIIYVKSAKGIDLKGLFDPVTVTGVLSTTAQITGLADAGYTIDAETVTAR